MSESTTRSARAVIAVFALAAAILSFVTVEWPRLTQSQFTPGTLLGAVVIMVVVVIALAHLFGTDAPLQEGVRLTHLAVGIAWSVYLLVGIAFVVGGTIKLVVLGHLAVSLGGGLVFGLLYRK